MPSGPQGQKRPADAVALAVVVGRIATGEVSEGVTPLTKSRASGGLARSESLTPTRRSELQSRLQTPGGQIGKVLNDQCH